MATVKVMLLGLYVVRSEECFIEWHGGFDVVGFVCSEK